MRSTTLLFLGLLFIVACKPKTSDSENQQAAADSAAKPGAMQTQQMPPPQPPATAPMMAPGKHGDTTVLASGVWFIDQKVGKGDGVKEGQTVTANYTGKLTDGTTFDSNVDPKFGHTDPFSTQLDAHHLIPGWVEGMSGMKIGGKRRMMIPAKMGYGPNGNGPVPPNADLFFDVELLKIQ